MTAIAEHAVARAGDSVAIEYSDNGNGMARDHSWRVPAQEYEAAYRAMPDPAFLFNIAQSQRQQYYQDKKPGRLQKALSLYKSYLREMPKVQNRETVRKILRQAGIAPKRRRKPPRHRSRRPRRRSPPSGRPHRRGVQ